jgi:hypothetical protein
MKEFLKGTLQFLAYFIGIPALVLGAGFGMNKLDKWLKSINDEEETKIIVVSQPNVSIPTKQGYNAFTSNIEVEATPEEFSEYFGKILAKDTINQIMISGQSMGNDTKKLRWGIVYNNYNSMQ